MALKGYSITYGHAGSDNMHWITTGRVTCATWDTSHVLASMGLAILTFSFSLKLSVHGTLRIPAQSLSKAFVHHDRVELTIPSPSGICSVCVSVCRPFYPVLST